MSQLASIHSMWENPEGSYKKMEMAGRVSDRFSFLKLALAYSPNNDGAVKIREMLGVEMNSYTKEEQEECMELLKFLDNLYKVIKENDDAPPEITNLNEFCQKIREEDNSDDDDDDEKTLVKLSDYTLMLGEEFCSAQTAISNGFFLNATSYLGGKLESFRIDPFDPDYKVFYCQEEIIEFLQNYTYHTSDFFDKVYNTCMYLILNDYETTGTLIFMSPNLYRDTGGTITLSAKNNEDGLIVDYTEKNEVCDSVKFQVEDKIISPRVHFVQVPVHAKITHPVFFLK